MQYDGIPYQCYAHVKTDNGCVRGAASIISSKFHCSNCRRGKSVYMVVNGRATEITDEHVAGWKLQEEKEQQQQQENPEITSPRVQVSAK